MRKLNLKDVFRLAEIIKKAKIRSELAALVSSVSAENAAKTDKSGDFGEKGAKNAEKIAEKVGISFILLLIEAAPAVEREVYELVASIKGVEPEQVQAMTLDEIAGFCREVAQNNDLRGFFSSAASSLTSL